MDLPCCEEFLGDKLTAFAPNTLGVPYHKNKSLDMIKQLFDIAALFDIVNDCSIVDSSHQRVFEIQNAFFGNQYTRADVLNDTIETAYLICQLDLKNSVENENTEELRRGMKQIRSYLLLDSFAFPEIKIAASKAAFIATILRDNHSVDLATVRFDDDKLKNLSEKQVAEKHNVLDRLRYTAPEAFYYWHLVSQLTTR